MLSTRDHRGVNIKVENPVGILDKDDLIWIDGKKLMINNEEVVLHDLSGMPNLNISDEPEMLPKQLVKMGAYLAIFPDKFWYNTETKERGRMDVYHSGRATMRFSMVNSKGEDITTHPAEYYEENEPSEGDYMTSEKDGLWTLKQYSETTGIWSPVTSTFCKMQMFGEDDISHEETDHFIKWINDGDGIKITIDSAGLSNKELQNIFVNKIDGDDTNRYTTVVIKNIDYANGVFVIPGIVHAPIEITGHLAVERVVPDMAYVTECNNRIWGCDKNGHEIYCCKLGDLKNWNVFQGISTDSYAATIGSDGKWTGAVTYMGYPMFFKEDSFAKVSVSATGGHQIKETNCRGVEAGSYRSLQIVNEVLYYKSINCICAYNGSLPVSVSDALGEVKYRQGVAGAIDDKYYISMRNYDGFPEMLCYDTKNGMWVKEDDTEAIFFCKHKDDLYYFDAKTHELVSVYGTILYPNDESYLEGKFDWKVESGNIGYSDPDNKYVARVSVRLGVEHGTNVDFWIQYNSSGNWEHKFSMSGRGRGLRTVTMPFIPSRCDHFAYKITGRGDAKLYGITKTIMQGSDTNV